MRAIYLFVMDSIRLMRGQPLLGEVLTDVSGASFEERMSREYDEVAAYLAR